MNKVILSGGLTKDPELSSTPSGKKLAKFSLAVSDYKDSTLYFDCTCWGERGETLAKYCKKGSQVVVDGKIKIDEFEKDGQKRRKYLIVVNDWEFNRGNKSSGEADKSTENPAGKSTSSSVKEEPKKEASCQPNSDEAGAPMEASYDVPPEGLPF